MTFRQKTMAKLGKEPAVPGYTGYIPALRNHLIGHSFGDSTRRAAACTESLRKKQYPKAIELTVESRPQDRNFFYAQLSRAALEQPPKAIHWIASKRDLPIEMSATSGLVDVRKMRTCIGTTPEAVTTCAPHMSIPDPPYKDRHLCTRREFEALKDDCLEVAEARHHVKGYSGHYHAKQHLYGKSYGKITRELRPLPANPKTSREYQLYQDNRSLMVNEFELKRKLKYNHFTLLPPGHKPGGPGYIEGNIGRKAQYKYPSDKRKSEEMDDVKTFDIGRVAELAEHSSSSDEGKLDEYCTPSDGPGPPCYCPDCLPTDTKYCISMSSRPRVQWKFPDGDAVVREKDESSSSASSRPSTSHASLDKGTDPGGRGEPSSSASRRPTTWCPSPEGKTVVRERDESSGSAISRPSTSSAPASPDSTTEVLTNSPIPSRSRHQWKFPQR